MCTCSALEQKHWPASVLAGHARGCARDRVDSAWGAAPGGRAAPPEGRGGSLRCGGGAPAVCAACMLVLVLLVRRAAGRGETVR